MFFCGACRRCFELSEQRSHQRNRDHIERRDKILQKESTRLQELQFFFDNVQLCRGVEPDYWCHFCEEKLDSSQNQTVCFLVFKHLASNAHRKRVEEFCQATGVSATKPLDNFCIPRPRLQKGRASIFVQLLSS